MITPDAALFELSDLEICRDHLVSQIQFRTIRVPPLSGGMIRLLTRVLSTDPDPHELLGAWPSSLERQAPGLGPPPQRERSWLR